MAKYKREVTEYIKDRVDIIDVIGSSVSLKKTGRNYKGLCPFHSEKTPSFVVSQERQFYHCFGCGKSGSIFNYVMETENVDFLDALESLAERYGIDLTPFIESDQGRQKYDNRQRLYDVMQSAARYYFKQLGGSQVARQYLQGRQLSDATARHFGLGYAPDGWQNIIEFAERAGFTRRELLDCGLILKNEQSRYYDRFRNRLMFPIFDRRGRVVAFGGRVLDDGLPKYLNSPETTIFHKSNVLYGLNFAKKRINKEKSVILVEGYMDVIALHQHGYSNAVASLGTALTPHHVVQLDRIYDRVFFAYDGDKAGRNAIMNSLAVFKGSKLNVKVLDMGDYKDPDEVLKNVGADGFNRLLATAVDTISFAIVQLEQNYDLNNPDQRIMFMQAAFEYADALDLMSQRQIFIEALAKRLQLNPKSVVYDYKKWHDKVASKSSYRSPDKALETTEQPVDTVVRNEYSKLYRIERALVAALLRGQIDSAAFRLNVKELSDNNLKALADSTIDYFDKYGAFEAQQAIAHFDIEQLEMIEALKEIAVDLSDRKALRKVTLGHRQLILIEMRNEIDRAIAENRVMAGDDQALQQRELLVKRVAIQTELADINKALRAST